MGPAWGDWEVKVLQSEKDTLPLTTIAKLIGRTSNGVRSFLSRSEFNREYICHYCNKPIENGKTQQKFHKECFPLARAEYIQNRTRIISIRRKRNREIEERRRRHAFLKLKELSEKCQVAKDSRIL